MILLTTGDIHRLAGNVGSLVRGKEGAGLGDIVLQAWPTQRNTCTHVGQVLLLRAAGSRAEVLVLPGTESGRYMVWTDRIDVDLVRPELDRRGARETGKPDLDA